jgi:hypothetical protein
MRCSLAIQITFLLWSGAQATAQQPEQAAAQQAQKVSTAVDMIKQICVIQSTSEKLSVSGSAKGEVSLQRLSTSGQVLGEVKFDKTSVQGLALGLNNEISALSADQANRMRACGQPFLKQIVDALLSPH